MIKRTHISKAVAAALLAVSAQVAFAVDEVEPNDSLLTAQRLFFSTNSVQLNGKIGATALGATPAGDVDFFSFEAQEGDVLTVDVDQGMKPKDLSQRSVDTTIAIFGPLPDVRKKRESLNMDPRLPRDPGSDDIRDALIENFRVERSGTYVVGVSSQPRFLTDGGGVLNPTSLGTFSNGAYTLNISGVTPAVQQVNIEIKPGSDADAPVNPRAKGNIPLALLSSKEFDALKVNPSSLTFGSSGDEKSWLRCSKEGLDVNADGLMDLVCHFDNVSADWQPDDVEGIVKGATQDGRRFEGHGRLKIVPKARD